MKIDAARWNQLRDGTAAPWVSPSLLAADMTALGDSVRLIAAEADLLHFDVMDGVFVPNISFGLPILSALAKLDVLPQDVHLMIADADRYVADFAEAGANILTVHQEACPHLHRTVQSIKAHGMRAGVVINPGTALSVLDAILPDVDMVLLMSVNPGFGGQSFIPETLDRVRQLRAMSQGLTHRPLIQVDGGVSAANSEALGAAGADILVAGSAVFGAEDPLRAIQDIREAAARGRARGDTQSAWV